MTSLLPLAVEPLPLPTPGWGAPQAVAAWHAALPALPAEVLAELGADTSVVRVSALTTVVLRVGPWAVKVYPPGTDARHLAGTAEALAGSDVAHLPVAAPVETPDGTVVVSRWLTGTRPPDWGEVGGLLARYHQEHATAPLAPWQPLSRVDSQAAALPPAAADVLVGARDRVLAAVASTWSELGWGAVHGDLSEENVLVDPAGPRLIDLDWATVAPRELDLAPVARRYAAGRIDRSTYTAFCRAYGHDVRGWEGLPLLDLVADLGGLVFRVWDCRHHGRDLDWLDAELPRWRQAC